MANISKVPLWEPGLEVQLFLVHWEDPSHERSHCHPTVPPHSSPSSTLIFFSASCQRARWNLQRPSKVKLFITLKTRRLTSKFQKEKTKTDFRHLYVCAYVLCPTLSDHVDCSLPGSPVHGILQATTLEWTAISFSRGSS